MKAITYENLKREIGDEGKARDVYNQIADIGGFGDIGKEFKDGLPALDVSGLSEAKQQRVEEIIANAKTEAPKDSDAKPDAPKDSDKSNKKEGK